MKQKTTYIDSRLDINYRLGKHFNFNGNLQYTGARFSEDIGSVSGFSGVGINFGLGIIF